MKINGLKVDAQKIADGLYEIICEAGEEAIVAFGMIPKWVMDMFERELRDKIIAEAAAQMRVTVEEFRPYIDEELVKKTMRPIILEVSIGIYRAATKTGIMIV